MMSQVLRYPLFLVTGLEFEGQTLKVQFSRSLTSTWDYSCISACIWKYGLASYLPVLPAQKIRQKNLFSKHSFSPSLLGVYKIPQLNLDWAMHLALASKSDGECYVWAQPSQDIGSYQLAWWEEGILTYHATFSLSPRKRLEAKTQKLTGGLINALRIICYAIDN